MAQILVTGPMATIEIEMTDFGVVQASCIKHSESDGRTFPAGNCDASWAFSTWADAMSTGDIERHADRGDR